MIHSVLGLHIDTVRDIGWTLIHFLWQGLALAALLQIILPLCRTAAVRHGWAFATAVMMALSPLSTFLVIRASHSAATPTAAVSEPALQSGERAVALYVPSSLSLPWMDWVVALWFAGIAVLSLRALGGWYLAEALRRRDTLPLPADLHARCRALQQRLALSSPVRFLQSHAVRSLAVVGWFRPVVLIPVAAITGLPPQHLEALIVHELAHIRRFDAFTNLLLIAIETVLFYHPAVWWVTGRVRSEREECCDDVAVAVCGDAAVYVEALASLDAHKEPAFALAANHGRLKQRAARLLGVLPEPRRFSVSAITGLVLLCLIGASIATAQSSSPATPQPFALRIVADGPDKSNTDPVPVSAPKSGLPAELSLKREGQVTADMVAETQAAQQKDSWIVNFRLTPEGTARFAAMTRANVGGRVAIVVNGEVISAPTIRSEIVGGKAYIEGDFTEAQARAVAETIKPAKAPAPKAFATPDIQQASMAPRDALGRYLIEVIQHDNLPAARELLASGADANYYLPGDGTPLVAAARANSTDAVDALLKAGADPNLAAPGDGNPLIASASQGSLAVMTLLVARGADVNAVVAGDESPLINASRNGEIEAVKYLISKGADVNLGVLASTSGTAGSELRTPLGMALKNHHADVGDLLRSAGAKD